MAACLFSRNRVLHNNTRLTKRAPDAGDSAAIPSLFYALSFFWLDGFAVPAPAQVTHAVGQFLAKLIFKESRTVNTCSSKSNLQPSKP